MGLNPYSKFEADRKLNKNNLPEKINDRIQPFLEDNPEGLVLDLGAGNSPMVNQRVVQFDMFQYENTTVQGDALRLPFKDHSFSAVFCDAVLEHVTKPFVVGEEIKRVLKPGGYVDVSVPFVFPYHDVPDHFFNMSVSGLRVIFEDLEETDAGVLKCPAYALRNIIGNYKKMLKRVYKDGSVGIIQKIRCFLVYRFMSTGLKFNLESIPLTFEEKHTLAGAVYFRGLKN